MPETPCIEDNCDQVADRSYTRCLLHRSQNTQKPYRECPNCESLFVSETREVCSTCHRETRPLCGNGCGRAAIVDSSGSTRHCKACVYGKQCDTCGVKYELLAKTGNNTCNKCLRESTHPCVKCESATTNDTLCDVCIRKGFAQCSLCHEWWRLHSSGVCSTCRRENRFECDHDSQILHNGYCVECFVLSSHNLLEQDTQNKIGRCSFCGSVAIRTGERAQCANWQSWRQRASRYAMDPRGLADFYIKCNGACAICGVTETGAAILSIDHDHACCPTAKSCGDCVRSLLCIRHNTVLGQVYDDPDTLRALADYIEGHSSLCGQSSNKAHTAYKGQHT
jgi:hypothetical protein